MFNYLDSLRRKPERQRRLIAFSVALSVSGLILVVWLTVIYPDFMRAEVEKDKAVAEKLAPISTPISNLSATVSAGWERISSQMSAIKNIYSQFSAAAEYYSASTTASTTRTRTATPPVEFSQATSSMKFSTSSPFGY